VKLAQVALEKTFSSIFTGGDISAAKIAYTNQITILGGNTAKANAVVETLGAIASVFSSNPNETQKTLISAKVAAFYKEGVALVLSQPGLENIDTDPVILNDPKFSSFADFFNQLKNDSDFVRLNPERSYDYYSNITDEYADFLVQMVQISKEVVARKAAGKIVVICY
jgi:hypothetical protein